MLGRQPILRIAVVALTAAVFHALTLLPGDKDEKAKQADAPDLFPFIQALPDDVPDESSSANAEVQAGHISETTASPAAGIDATAAADAFRSEEMVRQMRASGASDDEVYRARAAAMNAEKAAALARLDREEDTWQRRIAAYQAQRNAVDPHALQELRNRLFTAEEQERLAAYEPSGTLLPGLP
jgi:hypothetical protein